jgi:hypothetical protein
LANLLRRPLIWDDLPHLAHLQEDDDLGQEAHLAHLQEAHLSRLRRCLADRRPRRRPFVRAWSLGVSWGNLAHLVAHLAPNLAHPPVPI